MSEVEEGGLDDNLQRIEQLIAAYAQTQNTDKFLVKGGGDYWTNNDSEGGVSGSFISYDLKVFVDEVLVFARYEEDQVNYIPDLNKAWVIRDRNIFYGRMYDELVKEGF